ncbi:hypothetical protein D3C87_85800 [compost metagenome]
MKSLLTILFSIILSLSYAQGVEYISDSIYAIRKANGTLTGNEVPLSSNMINPSTIPGGKHYVAYINTPKATGCEGYFAPPQGPVTLPGSADDFGMGPYNLPFTFCFFGDNYTSVYFNGNGNISFGGTIPGFSVTGFPSLNNRMIAPFWADFDFNGPNPGTMHVTISPTAAVFNWVGGGYFNQQVDKRNTCQVVITDGTDPLIVGGNVAINYADMQWTTGSANGGVNGFLGTAATAGANRGNGVDFFTIGRFDHEGTDYDGPLGANDGVSFLDYKSFYFDFCNTNGGNIPPVPLQTAYCDTFQVCGVGDTMDITFPYLSPELNQLTTVTFSSPTLQNVVVVNSTVANTGELTLRIIGDLETPGMHDLIITGTDNAAIPGVTEVTYMVKINDPDSVFTVIPSINYTSSCPPVALSVSEPYDGYLWSPGNATTAINTINTGFDGVVTVILEKHGCKLTIDSAIYIPNPPQFNLQGSYSYCSADLHTTLSIPDTLALSSADWKLNGTSVGTDYTENLSAGNYTLSIVDSSGVCTSDTTFTIVSILSPVIFADTIACNFAFQVQGTVSPSGGLWSAADTAVHFSNASILNPLITATEAGMYQITYTDSLCGTRTTNLEFIDYAFATTIDTVVCFGVTITTSSGTYPQNDTYVWNEGTVGPTITAGPGVYTVTVSNECNTHSSTMTISGKVCYINAPNIIVLSSTSGNNKFYLTYDGVDEFHMTIVNRWGNLIAEFDDPAAAWDGKDKGGNIMEEGTYFYNFTAKMATGEEVKKQGFVQVFH